MAPLMIIGSVPLYNIFAVIVLTFESGHDSTDSSANIRRAFINILKNPIIIGIFAGLVASYVNLTLPGMVTKSINNLAVMTSPLALLSIGAGFEGRKALAKLKPTFVASFMKLLGWARDLPAYRRMAGIPGSGADRPSYYAGFSVYTRRLHYGKKYGW